MVKGVPVKLEPAYTCISTVTLPSNISHVVLYSDTCGGQNRNRFIACVLANIVLQSKSIKVIDHKFMESGHSHMEVDSIHAAIETAKKSTSVYIPRDWQTVCHLARRHKRYNVIPLDYTSFLDFKEHSKLIMPSLSQVNWMKVKWMRYELQEVSSSEQRDGENLLGKALGIYFKYEFDGTFQKVLDRKTRSTSQLESECSGPKQLYSEKLPISVEKKKNLLQLCSDGTVPEDFHEFYRNLPTKTSSKCDDMLPEPDVEEDSDID